DANNPDVSKRSRPTLVMPILLEIRGCVLGFLCGGETWTRVGSPIPSSPAYSMARGLQAQREDGDHHGLGRTEQHWLGWRGRPGRRYLSTRRCGAACPLAPAGTGARRRASSPATARAA